MKGLIFIPDINGFTNFVKTIPAELGATIMQDLLSAMMNSNILNMDVSEIEGDAILFYKLGAPHRLSELIYAFMTMQNVFKKNYGHYQDKYNLKTALSLKLIVHYGDIILYDIKGFKKLYGEAIIEAHRLLKNGNTSNDYILITEDYMKALSVKVSDILIQDTATATHKILDHVKNIAYHIFPNAKRHLVLQT